MNRGEASRILAFAAAVQAVQAIRAIAAQGQADPGEVETCLQGLIRPYAGDVGDVYGGIPALRNGLLVLTEQLRQPTDMELTRYLLTLLQLESRLRRSPERLAALAAGLERVRRQMEYFGGTNLSVGSASLGGLYSEQVSSLRPRVMVSGERRHLEQDRNATQIRALLLAALRALSLWRDQGGRRWHFLLYRRRLLVAAEDLLRH